MRGSFINRLHEGLETETPFVGMGATEMLYSDRHAYTVQKIISGKRVVVTRDNVVRIDENGASEDQDCVYESTPLWEGKREKQCRNYAVQVVTSAEKQPKEKWCKTLLEGGTCEGCPFFKLHKPTNGKTLIKTKRGWKELGGSSYFTLGIREEYFDYSF